MSENLSQNKPENNKSKEQGSEAKNDHIEKLAKHHERQAKHAKHEHQDQIDQILDKIETSSKSSEELSKHSQTEDDTKQDQDEFVGSGVKKRAFTQTLTRTRKQLKPYQKPVSKIIHNDVVEKVSEVGSKTVARPSGLLVGGMTSLITSVVVLALTRYYGYEYNYFVAIASFGGGFAIGIIGELLLKTFKKS